MYIIYITRVYNICMIFEVGWPATQYVIKYVINVIKLLSGYAVSISWCLTKEARTHRCGGTVSVILKSLDHKQLIREEQAK